MKRVSLCATVVALVLFPTAVLATAVIAETMEEMTQHSSMVVRGTVRQVQVQLNNDTGRIYTYADIQVTEGLKGSRGGSVLVKTPGGEILGRGQGVAGAGTFVTGQDTVLFLEPAVDEQGVWILRALAAGKIDLEKSSKGELRAVRHLEGIAFFDKAGSTVRRVHPEDDLGTPDAFLARIRTAALAGAR